MSRVSTVLELTRRELRVLRSLTEYPTERTMTASALAPHVIRIGGYDRALTVEQTREALETLKEIGLVDFAPLVGWCRTLRGDGAVLAVWISAGPSGRRWKRV